MQHHEVDLTPYIGTAIRLRFTMDGGGSDYFLYVTQGWWVDDVTIEGATWHTLATAPADATQLQVTGRFNGSYAYRVRAVFTDGSATAFGNVEGIDVQGLGGPAGRVGPTLRLARSGEDLVLEWGASCTASDDDYEVYEGTLGAFYSHVPKLCSTGGALSATIPADVGDHYYLVVPRNVAFEGSYGKASNGVERPAGSTSCSTASLASCP
jgi:hypothetical protein